MSNKAATIEPRATSHEPRATSHEFDSCPLISVIIPVYNVEKYLDECVNSVLNQTYRNLEVILVDDGSTDKSPAMCDEWAHRDSRVRVIHKDNGGAALARNAGLETANGAFIATVDSDDFIAPNMYERLYTLLTDNDADLSICEFSLIDEAGNILVMEGNKMPAEVLSGTDALRKFLDGISLNYLYLWNRLHKREIFRDIRFPAGNRQMIRQQYTTYSESAER